MPELGGSTARQADEARQAGSMYDELRETGTPRVNLLLVGPDAVTRRAVTLIVGDRDEPIWSWRAGDPFLFPAVGPGGTIVLHDVGALPYADQVQLLAWLEEAVGHTHLISTTPRSLLPDVLNGTFSEALFYRLNTVCLKPTD